jgi:hypothetical protein
VRKLLFYIFANLDCNLHWQLRVGATSFQFMQMFNCSISICYYDVCLCHVVFVFEGNVLLLVTGSVQPYDWFSPSILSTTTSPYFFRTVFLSTRKYPGNLRTSQLRVLTVNPAGSYKKFREQKYQENAHRKKKKTSKISLKGTSMRSRFLHQWM